MLDGGLSRFLTRNRSKLLRGTGKVVGTCMYGYLVVLIGLWALLWLAGDRWWFATLLLMGPRWIYALPMIVLMPLAVFWRRAWLWPLGISAVLMAWPIMGFNIPLRAGGKAERPMLRVLTCNVDVWKAEEVDFLALVDSLRPDLIAIQECPSNWKNKFDGWHLQYATETIVASRYPITQVDTSVGRLPLEHPDVNGLYCVVESPHGPIGFASIHLDTPRRGLELILDRDTIIDLSRLDEAKEYLRLRHLDSEELSSWLSSFPEPKIIAGDFNMPIDSTIYRAYWSKYENAFSGTGFGFGHTKRTEINIFRYGSRIDHILTGPQWHCVRSWVGPAIGSDHLPLIADLVLD